MNKKIREIAERIISLENSMQSDSKCDLEILGEIENIASTLSLEEMLQVDDYIQKKFFDFWKIFWYNIGIVNEI